MKTCGKLLTGATCLLLLQGPFTWSGPLSEIFGAGSAVAQNQFLPQSGNFISEVRVQGNQRVEVETVLAYMFIGEGDLYDAVLVDRSLKELFDTGLFGDVNIQLTESTLLVTVVENPIINRIIFEGNSSVDTEELMEDSQLGARDIYTRSKVRSEVTRIIEVYRRSGRFSASVEPKVVLLEENRVDLVYEIDEGEKTGVRRISFIGNRAFSDGDLRDVIQTQQSQWWNFLQSEDNYDPDRLAFDKQLLRQFYNQNGYADFTVISAVAELTPDQADFYITFTIREGPVYEFGEVSVASEIEEVDPSDFITGLFTRSGQRFNGQEIEDSVERLEFALGSRGFAFAQIRPLLDRSPETGIINLTYQILEAPRVYVERINILGNRRTLDRVIRREMRLAEGDAFNAAKMERSRVRIQSLGFFSEVEVTEVQGSQPDRTIIDVNVEEQATGELSFGIGFSSTDNFLFDLNVTERNLLGRGQRLRLGAQLSGLQSSINLGFTEPYFMNRPLSLGVDLFRQSSNFSRFGSFDTSSTGIRISTGFPIVEYLSFFGSYMLAAQEVTVDPNVVDPGLFLGLGTEISSGVILGLTYANVDNPIRPRSGLFITGNTSFTGLGGDVRILAGTARMRYFYPVSQDWTLMIGGEFGIAEGLGQPIDANNRSFLGGQSFRGFDIGGVGPRSCLVVLLVGPEGCTSQTGDSLGGNKFWMATAELQFPIPFAEDFGMRGSAFVEAGALTDVDLQSPLIVDSGSPRLSVGIGVQWESPFGPLSFSLSRALIHEPFDDTQTFLFNVTSGF